MELALLILILSGMFVGTVCGVLYRRAKIAQIRSRQTSIPAYQLDHHLSPVEFAIICEGVVTDRAVAAQLIALVMNRHLSVERSDEGKIIIRRADSQTRKTSEDVAFIRHFVPNDQTEAIFTGGSYLRSPLSYEAMTSLKQKGWLSEDAHELEGATISGPTIAAISIAFLVGGAGIVMISLDMTRTLLFENIAILMMLFAVIILVFLIIRYTFIYHAQKSFRSHSRVARLITPRFTQEYHTVYGIYLYLKVSGLDTMTPDYATLDFEGLDKLYPYAVAVGLDPKIIKSLQ